MAQLNPQDPIKLLQDLRFALADRITVNEESLD